MLEALVGAGYRPTVYRSVAPPSFINCSGQVAEVLDPFDCHSAGLSPRWAWLPRSPALPCPLACPPPALPRAPGASHVLAVVCLAAHRAAGPLLLPPGCRLVFVARGGVWSLTTHHHWPDTFKAAARTLLLAGSRAGSSFDAGRRAAPAPAGLAALPADMLVAHHSAGGGTHVCLAVTLHATPPL